MTKSILIADDDENIRKMIRRRLETAGYDCSEAADGFDALEKTATLRPDLLIVGARMRNLNGIQVASLLRPRMPAVKVILLATYDDAGRNFTSALGVEAVIVRPHGVHRLVECVQQLLAVTRRPTPWRPDSPPMAA